MYGFSTAVKNAYKAGARQGVTLTITPTTGTAITLTEANIVENSFAIDRMTSISGGIPFGTAYSNALSFTISDPSRTYAAFNWRGARIDVSLYVYVGTTRTLAGTGGRFYVKRHKAKVATVEVSALGSLSKLDTPFTNAGASGTYTIAQVLQQVSQQIWGNTTTIDFSAVSSAAAQSLGTIKLPEGEDVTCRNIVGWCAALCGASVIEHGSADGLVLIRKSASGETINSANRFSGDSGEDVAITGVKGYDAAGNAVSHTDGSADEYNLIIQSNGIYENAPNRASILSALYTALVGFSMTPFTADTLAMPWLECGDSISYVDAGGTTHSTFVTHIRITLGGRTEISCDVASLEERDANVNIAPYIERSSITRQDLRTDAIKSSNYVFSGNDGRWADSGTFLDLANGTVTSHSFVIDSNGDAYIRGTINASAGSIGALTIDSQGLVLNDIDPDDTPYVRTAFKRDYLVIDDPDDDAVFLVERASAQVRMLWYDSGLQLECTSSKIELSNGSGAIEVRAATGEIVISGDTYLDDDGSGQYGDTTNTIQKRLYDLEQGGGGGGIGGSGTANYIPKWTDASTLGNSIMYAPTATVIKVDAQDGSAGASGYSELWVGNNTPYTDAGNSQGVIKIFGLGSGSMQLRYTGSSEILNYWFAGRSTDQDIVSVNGGQTLTNLIPIFDSNESGHLSPSIMRATTANALQIDAYDGTVSSPGASVLLLGNGTAAGTAGNSQGRLWIYGTGSAYADLLYGGTANSVVYSFEDTAAAGLGTWQNVCSINGYYGVTLGAIPKFDSNLGHLTNSEIAGTSLASPTNITTGSNSLAFFDTNNVIRRTNNAGQVWQWLGLKGLPSEDGYYLSWDATDEIATWSAPSWLTSAVTGMRAATSGAFSTGNVELIKGSVSSTTELSITKSTPSTGVTRFTFNLFNTCLIAGTKILMADNTEKPIEEIKQGDEVASWDVNNGTRTTAIVLTAHATGADCEYTAHLFDDGSYIVVFGQHSVYNKTLGYPTDISKFREGDETYNANGEIIHYAGSTRYFSRAERVAHYDINTSNNLYYANGILNGKNTFAKYRAMKAEGMTLPEAIQAAFDAQNVASEAIIGYETNPEYLSAIAAKLKEKSHISRLIDEAKKHLADTDYLVNKWTEGILTAIEWLKAKADRADWRNVVNTQEGLLATVETQLAAIKAQFKTAHGSARTRFETLSLQDNYRLADYREWLSNGE